MGIPQRRRGIPALGHHRSNRGAQVPRAGQLPVPRRGGHGRRRDQRHGGHGIHLQRRAVCLRGGRIRRVPAGMETHGIYRRLLSDGRRRLLPERWIRQRRHGNRGCLCAIRALGGVRGSGVRRRRHRGIPVLELHRERVGQLGLQGLRQLPVRQDGLPQRKHTLFPAGILQAQVLRRLDGTALQARGNLRLERRGIRLYEKRPQGMAAGMHRFLHRHRRRRRDLLRHQTHPGRGHPGRIVHRHPVHQGILVLRKQRPNHGREHTRKLLRGGGRQRQRGRLRIRFQQRFPRGIHVKVGQRLWKIPNLPAMRGLRPGEHGRDQVLRRRCRASRGHVRLLRRCRLHQRQSVHEIHGQNHHEHRYLPRHIPGEIPGNSHVGLFWHQGLAHGGLGKRSDLLFLVHCAVDLWVRRRLLLQSQGGNQLPTHVWMGQFQGTPGHDVKKQTNKQQQKM